MPPSSPFYFQDVERCVEEIIARIGPQIVLAIPLGIGKPNPLVNALYRRVKADSDLHLKILTAITVELPKGSNELERRFLEPFVKRVFGDYPDLEYAVDLRSGRMPPNIEVSEFFLKPGGFLSTPMQQQNYISANYTHAVRDLMDNGVNVLAQLVAEREIDGVKWLSLGSNPDMTLDFLPMFEAARYQGRSMLTIAEVHREMPFMYHDAMVPPSTFDLVLDHPTYDFRLFAPPNMAVDQTDYLLGLQTSALIRDGGSLQIGIGCLGDALVYFCQLRQRQNVLYQQMLSDLKILEHHGDLIQRVGGIEPFTQGLHGSSEMFVNGFLHLYRDGILKRRVYDSIPLQRLLNEGAITETVNEQTLQALLERGVISARLTESDYEFLHRFGILNHQVRYQNGQLLIGDTMRIPARLDQPESWSAIINCGLGNRLQGGIVMRGGFFMGPSDFYEALRTLPEADQQQICMTSVKRINHLHGNEELAVLQRRDARFINTTTRMTLLGAAVSDGLDNGQVISGVGGQYNFVAMAHELPGARSLFMLRSTRTVGPNTISNIVWNYGHITIPRHLRDIVITEYGIADLRGRPDKEVIAALLNIADSRFQAELLEVAKQAGKIAQDYQIPPQYRHNTPDHVQAQLGAYKKMGLCPDFPLGTDFTEEEIVLGHILKGLRLRLATKSDWMKTVIRAMTVGETPEAAQCYLTRLQLDQPTGQKEKILQKIIVSELIAGNYI